VTDASKVSLFEKLFPVNLGPFEHIRMQYSSAWELRFKETYGLQIYETYGAEGSLFLSGDRIRLVQSALARSAVADKEHKSLGAGLRLKKLIASKQLLAAFPLQEQHVRQTAEEGSPAQLTRVISSPLRVPWRLPLNKLRLYAGEMVAFYFGFLGHYTKWLFPLALIGAAVSAHQLYTMYSLTGSFNIFSSRSSDILYSLDGAVYRELALPAGIPLAELVDASAVAEWLRNRTETAALAPIFDPGSNVTFKVRENTRVPEAPYFALLVALWATLFIEFWSRKQAWLALTWGVSDYAARAKPRPEFRFSHIVPSAVTGEPEEYYSSSSFAARVAFSVSVVLTCLTAVVAAIAGVLILKVYMSAPALEFELLPPDQAPKAALVVNSVVILGLGYLYPYVARWLNDLENHRTDVDYENSLVYKTFVISFINSYALLFYMAFLKSGSDVLNVRQYCVAVAEELAALHVDQSKLDRADACYGTLGYSLAIIFGTQLVGNNMIELGWPWLRDLARSWFNVRRSAKRLQREAGEAAAQVKVGIEAAGEAVGAFRHADKARATDDAREDAEEKQDLPLDTEDFNVRRRLMSPAEHQFLLEEFSTPLDDYLELVIQFGYVTLFVAAFPMAPLLAVVNNYFELRVDAFKLLHLSRRTDQDPAQNIGAWHKIFVWMGWASVFTNASVVCFTTDFIEASTAWRVWYWNIFIGTVLAVKLLIGAVIPNVPEAVQIQLRRQAFFERKVFLLEQADVDVPLEHTETAEETPVLSVDPYISEVVQRCRELLSAAGNPSATVTEQLFAKGKALSRRELSRALLALRDAARFLSLADVEILVKAMDADGDGRVAQGHFQRFLGLDSRSSV
jgi:anoctamin-4